ncbi:MAG: putative zinc-binding protein [Deltaproteobacteria bacterium]|nr:putative zinc-binding protein [Deltaproteobacteria bacterium]
MAQDCCTPSGNIMILACSGGSNVGQLSNQAAVELTREGFGKMFCLAGIGGGLSGFVQSARDVPSLVVIDGCSVACAKATFEQADVPLRGYLVITDLGIEKNKDFNLKPEDLARVKQAVRDAAKSQTSAAAGEATSNCCC